MKPFFKLPLTVKWPSDKGLGGCLNPNAGPFLVIRFAPLPAWERESWAVPRSDLSDIALAPLSLTPLRAHFLAMGIA